MTRIQASLAVLCATLALAACSGSDDTTARDPGRGEDTMSETPSGEQPGGAAGNPAAAEAVADLAGRLGVTEDEVTVRGVEEVTWNDGSLGCAEKGTMYTQALVDGSRITLAVGEDTYEYHSGGNRSPFLCEEPTQ